MSETIEQLECHDCGHTLNRIGESEFGRCSECERIMLFSEWQTIQDKHKKGDEAESVR